jgi:hypothetical protein
MEEQNKNNHQSLNKELLTIEENPIDINKIQRNNVKRLYTFNFKNFTKITKTIPKLERIHNNKKEILSQTPKRKTDSNLSLNNYLNLNNLEKNKKLQLHNNISPTLSSNNENDLMLNTNYNSSQIENKYFERFNKKIIEFYSMYQKTYENNSMEDINKSKNKTKLIFKTINNTNDNNNEKSKKINLFLSEKRNDNNIHKINKRNNYLSNIKSKTIEKNRIKNSNSLNLNKKHNFFNHSYKNTFKRDQNIKYPTCLTEGNKKRYSILNRKQSNSFLRTKVSDLIRELNLKKSSEYYLIKREERAEKMRNKNLNNKPNDVRGKLVSLLNRPAENQNEKEFSKINYFSKRKIQKGENPMLIRKPTNNIEMNNLIINSFGAGYNHNEFSKKIFNLNETFFALLENMKQKRAEMDIAKFEKEKNKYIKKGFQKQNYEAYFQKRDRWEKKFMHDQYIYRIPETEFKKFKKFKQNELKKQIIKDSQKLSELLTNMDAEEYEFPDTISKYFKSTKNSISIKNVKRIYRVQKIIKNIEDEEQTGKIIIKADKLKKEQRNIETEIISAIGRSGKPRFVKTLFKPRTIRKYKGISGNYFGLPA